VPNDVTGNFRRQCEWESHNSILRLFGLNEFKNSEASDHDTWLICGHGAIGVSRRGIGLKQPRQEEGSRRYAARGTNATAPGAQHQQSWQGREPQNFPI
jgi:hypothetical protein